MSVTVPLDIPIETRETTISIDELNKIWFENSTDKETPWQVVILDDDVTPMNYVVHVFMKHFGLEMSYAVKKMMQVHVEGRSILARGAWEEMLEHRDAMIGYGLRSQVEQ